MLDPEILARAVAIQDHSFRLLKWIETAVNQGQLSAHMASRGMSDAEAIGHWLATNYQAIPIENRPASDRPEDITLTANFLCSFLLTSFDLVENAGRRPVPSTRDCPCPLCSVVLIKNSHLKPKKVTNIDKLRANELKVDYVRRLAEAAGFVSTLEAVEALVSKDENEEDVALATYGEQLIERVNGRMEGPALLVLWRAFAWTKAGSPKKDFQLEAEAMLAAERRLIEEVRKQGWPSNLDG